MSAVPTMTTAEVAAWRERMARYAGIPTFAELIVEALAESGRPDSPTLARQSMSLRQLQIVTGMYETSLLGLLVILEQQGRIQREEVLNKYGTVHKRFWSKTRPGEKITETT